MQISTELHISIQFGKANLSFSDILKRDAVSKKEKKRNAKLGQSVSRFANNRALSGF